MPNKKWSADKQYTDKWVDGQKDGQIQKQIGGQTDSQIDWQMKGWTDRQLHEQSNGQIDGQKATRWTNGRIA